MSLSYHRRLPKQNVYCLAVIVFMPFNLECFGTVTWHSFPIIVHVKQCPLMHNFAQAEFVVVVFDSKTVYALDERPYEYKMELIEQNFQNHLGPWGPWVI
jgi:hypothetical protein